MAIFKKEPITHKLPTYYDDLEALGYINLNDIEGLRIYDNPLVAEQNSTYSCKNVYKDELGNLTVRPSLQFNRTSVPCKWYYTFTDINKKEYLFVKTDIALKCYISNNEVASIKIQSDSNIIPQEYFDTQANIAASSMYFLISNPSGYLRFIKYSDLGFTEVEGDIQIVDTSDIDISAYNILNKYQGEEKYFPDSPRTVDDYNVIASYKDKATALQLSEVRWLSDTIFLRIYPYFTGYIYLYLYTYEAQLWSYKKLTLKLSKDDDWSYNKTNSISIRYILTDLSDNTVELITYWEGILTAFKLYISDEATSKFTAEESWHYLVPNNMKYSIVQPLYNDYFCGITSEESNNTYVSTTGNYTWKYVFARVDIYKLDTTTLTAKLVSNKMLEYTPVNVVSSSSTGLGSVPSVTAIDGSKMTFLFHFASSNPQYNYTVPTGGSLTEVAKDGINPATLLNTVDRLNYAVQIAYPSGEQTILNNTEYDLRGKILNVSFSDTWSNVYSSKNTSLFATYQKAIDNDNVVGEFLIRKLYNTTTVDLSAYGEYASRTSNAHITVANNIVTMKHATNDTFITYNTNTNIVVEYSDAFEDIDIEIDTAIISDNGTSIALYNSSSNTTEYSSDITLILEQRAIVPRRLTTERDVTVIPVLTDIRDKPITGFYLANTYWFITEHYIFGTGAANEKLTIEFFDPYKYFAVSESITAAIRVSDTSFWVFHNNGAYLIYRTTTTDSDDNTVYRWLITNTPKSKGCDFENAVTTLPVNSYIATVTADDISSVQMKENIQSDERSLVPLTMNLGTFIGECLNETKSIKIVRYKYLSLFILNRTEANGTTPVLVYDDNTSNWWYWELPVSEVYHAVETETNVELLCNYYNDTVIYNLSNDWYEYNVGNLSYEIYADRLESSAEPTQINWVWESAVQLFKSVDYRKQLLSTTFTFGEYNKRLLTGGMEYNELSFRHEFEIYADKYSEKELAEEHDLIVERAKNRMVPTVIASFTYLQLILKNTPYDPEAYEYDQLCKPQISSISFKYRTLPGGIT